MSIDSFFYVPAGTRGLAPRKRVYKKYKTVADFVAAHDDRPFPHQVKWTAGGAIDEQYSFEDPQYAIWFFFSGWRDRDFFENGEDGVRGGYPPTAIWIDDKQRCEHCTKPLVPARASTSAATPVEGRWRSTASAGRMRTIVPNAKSVETKSSGARSAICRLST